MVIKAPNSWVPGSGFFFSSRKEFVSCASQDWSHLISLPFSNKEVPTCYTDFDLPVEIITGLEGNTLYLWFVYDMTPYPWDTGFDVSPRGHERENIFGPGLVVYQ